MRLLSLAFAAALVCSMMDGAFADDDGGCQIEEWRTYDLAGTLVIEGVTTCEQGILTLRVYEGEEFRGVATATIFGHAFKALVQKVQWSDTWTSATA